MNSYKKKTFFLQRYKQFEQAKQNGKPANYDFNDLNLTVYMPKSAIERQKQIIISETPSNKDVIRQINLKRQEFLTSKVKDFIKKLSINRQ